jgi:hypothetical protein
MFLAGILGSCMLLCLPVSGTAGGDGFPTSQQASSQDTTQTRTTPPAEPASQASETTEGATSSKTDKTPAKSKSSSPTKSGKKKKGDPQSTAGDATSKKKVVARGGTDEPTTQISPSMTEEQAAKTRTSINNLIAQTDENLTKLSARSLTAEEQETVDQIRKFVEQSKEADDDGDLPRAASLANKAKLLSDALVKP